MAAAAAPNGEAGSAGEEKSVLKCTGIQAEGQRGSGLFKCSADRLGWKDTSQVAGPTIACEGSQISEVFAWPVSKGHNALKLRLKDMSTLRFRGFGSEDLDSLKTHFKKHFKVDVSQKKLCTKGHSW